MTKSDNTTEIGMHVFQRAGLGIAPFRCIGVEEKFITHPDGTTQASGSCDYCGTGIRYKYTISDRFGKTFAVGCDCVEKTGDRGLIRGYKNLPEVRAMRRAKAAAKDDAVTAEWKALLAANEAKLSAIMVPGRPWVPGEMVTLLDDVKRVWAMCGASGRKRHLKVLKTRLASI